MKKGTPFKTTIYKIKKNIPQYWWIFLIIFVFIFILIVSLINNPELNRITNDFTKYLIDFIKPISIILGLVLGYPLLKRKLIDNYVTKQFEIIHDNNRLVRKECLTLKEKYPIKHISNPLNFEFIAELIEDVKRLNELSIDANPDTYKYSYLLYKSLQKFRERTQNLIPNNLLEHYHCETLSTFANIHIEQVYRYAMSIGFVPNNIIKVKPILTTKLKNVVVDNKYFQVEGIDFSISFKKASALLVAFFSNNITTLNYDNGLLFKCCYETLPSPAPFARILYNQEIYVPLVLEGEQILNFHVPKLVLVGYKRQKSTNFKDGIKTNFLICHYSNISLVDFVEGYLKEKKSLSEYKDSYININTLKINDIVEFSQNGESIIIKIHEDNAMKYFKQVKKQLLKKMNEEI